MSQTLKLSNYPEANLKQEGTRLNADSLAAATTITVENTADVTVGDYAIIGNLATETSEMASIKTLTSQTVLELNAALTLPHNRYETVKILNGNKIRVYRAANIDGTTPADSAFALLGTAIDIKVDQDFTYYTDADGSSSYWYKYTFYNSTTQSETNIASSRAVRGGNNNYVSISSIRNEAGFNNNRNITDAMIDEKRQIAQDEVNGALYGIYIVPFEAPINPTIENVSLQLATGYLLMSQYSFGAVRYTDGQDRVKSAQAILERIKSQQLVLTGVTGVELSQTNSDTNGASGWPNATTAGLDPGENGAGDFMFKRSSIDGYGTRTY